MAEYIEREELERILETRYERLAGLRPDFYAGFMRAARIVEEETRNADVAPVVHGVWVGIQYDGYADGCPVYDLWECSECHDEYESEGDPPHFNYCPNCGAKMDGKEKR